MSEIKIDNIHLAIGVLEGIILIHPNHPSLKKAKDFIENFVENLSDENAELRKRINQQNKNVKMYREEGGMSCKICERFNDQNVCDLTGPQPSFYYCRLFRPKADKVTKKKLLAMWEYHQQKFIRERQE